MIFLQAASLGFLMVVGTFGAPDQRVTSGSLKGRQDEALYSKYWANDDAVLDWEDRAGGEFAVIWDQPNGGNFVVGKGYNPGREIRFNYSGTFEPGVNSNTYLALYGWTFNPMVEYYVIESFGVHHPADHANSTCYGHFESDGGTYEVWMKYQTGVITFPQYWAVRTKRRVGGTLTTGNFFAAWEAAGLPLGDHDEMIIGVEGQWGSGQATLTAGVLPTTTVVESATPTTRTNVPTRTNTCTAVIEI